MATIDGLFDELLSRGASHLHLGADHPPTIRVKGELAPLGSEALDARAIEDLITPILTPDQRARFELHRDLDFAYSYGARGRFRASYFQKVTGVAAVFRAIPPTVPTLVELGAPDAVRKLAERRAGLVLVAGGAGSGKSSTLSAMIRHVNERRACRILTIEDPVELVHAPIRAEITHREIGPHAPTFEAAIRSAARESPDVVLVGELGTAGATRQVLVLASSGVLVFAAVRASGALAALDRIIHSFAEPEQPEARSLLADTLAGVVGQQMLPTADAASKVVAHEVLIGTSGVASMIRDGKTSQLAVAMQSGQAVGMQAMDAALERLVQQKRVTYEVAARRYADRENAEKKLKPLAG